MRRGCCSARPIIYSERGCCGGNPLRSGRSTQQHQDKHCKYGRDCQAADTADHDPLHDRINLMRPAPGRLTHKKGPAVYKRVIASEPRLSGAALCSDRRRRDRPPSQSSPENRAPHRLRCASNPNSAWRVSSGRLNWARPHATPREVLGSRLRNRPPRRVAAERKR